MLDSASGSTSKQCLCSREHRPAVFVLPEVQEMDTCAPGSTIKQKS